jgi:hypothetical protein
MKKYIPQVVSLAAITGWIAIAGNNVHAQTADSLLTESVDQSGFPRITAQPVDQTVPIGSDVVLSVQANNADGYQWLCNGIPLDGQTNSTLVIQNAGISDVGLYSCAVSQGTEAVPTRAASVSVETTANTTTAKATAASAFTASVTTSGAVAASLPGGGPITVFGTPILSSGSQSSCPGRYVGYAYYTNSTTWGWIPTPGATVLTATDTNRTNTKIQYLGYYGDSGCAQTSVTIFYPPFSPAYLFWVYFTNNVPTNKYPLLLTGFNP